MVTVLIAARIGQLQQAGGECISRRWMYYCSWVLAERRMKHLVSYAKQFSCSPHTVAGLDAATWAVNSIVACTAFAQCRDVGCARQKYILPSGTTDFLEKVFWCPLLVRLAHGCPF